MWNGDTFIEASKIVGPPILTAILVGFLANRWKFREDFVDKRIDNLFEEIKELGEVCSAYWELAPGSPDLKRNEAKISAGIARINSTVAALGPFLSRSAANEISVSSSSFFRIATGGNFGVHNRPADISRSEQVLIQSAHFSVACRRARLKDLKGFLRRK